MYFKSMNLKWLTKQYCCVHGLLDIFKDRCQKDAYRNLLSSIYFVLVPFANVMAAFCCSVSVVKIYFSLFIFLSYYIFHLFIWNKYRFYKIYSTNCWPMLASLGQKFLLIFVVFQRQPSLH